jgi:hypothetical protein
MPSTLTFPASATGRPGTMKALTLRNLSRTSALSVEVGSLAAPFTISGGGHYSIAPGTNVSISILLSPTQPGTASQSLTIGSSDPKHSQEAVKVTARIEGGKLSLPSRLSISAPLNTVVTKTVMLKNTGAGSLSGTVQGFGAESPFSLLGGPVSYWLSPGQTQAVTIAFTSTSAGTVHGSLAIAIAEPAGAASMSLTGSVR